MNCVKLICPVIMLMSIGSGALAQSRPLTLQMSCDDAGQLVASRGAVVLGTGSTTYDRYVSAVTQCVRGETLEPAWVPTADTRQCLIGYRCVERTRACLQRGSMRSLEFPFIRCDTLRVDGPAVAAP